MTQTLDDFLDRLRCPKSGKVRTLERDTLSTPDGRHQYPIRGGAIPAFAMRPASPKARQQLGYYDRITSAYRANLTYPHTIEYMAYLDACLLKVVGDGPFGVTAELCCGHGEAVSLFRSRIVRGVGLDISPQMLRLARLEHDAVHLCFVQGDATALPFASATFDTVFMLGGMNSPYSQSATSLLRSRANTQARRTFHISRANQRFLAVAHLAFDRLPVVTDSRSRK